VAQKNRRSAKHGRRNELRHITECATEWPLCCTQHNCQTYARLEFHVGPGGSLVLPVEVDYSRPFPASDHAAWCEAYLANVQVQEWPPVLGAGSHLEPGLRRQVADWSDLWDELLEENLVDSCEEDLDGGFDDDDI
jgi:hypothetical protein